MYKSNYLKLEMKAQGENVALARLALSGFLSRYDLDCDSLEEIKIALSEAVSNAIIHGYGNDENKLVTIEFSFKDGIFEMMIADEGVGIENIQKAMEVAYSTKVEHMGLGFAFMNSFSDRLEVDSVVGKGTRVTMRRTIESICTKNAV